MREREREKERDRECTYMVSACVCTEEKVMNVYVSVYWMAQERQG